jgi:hypothetical protein
MSCKRNAHCPTLDVIITAVVNLSAVTKDTLLDIHVCSTAVRLHFQCLYFPTSSSFLH